jgi:hypothetical protein
MRIFFPLNMYVLTSICLFLFAEIQILNTIETNDNFHMAELMDYISDNLLTDVSCDLECIEDGTKLFYFFLQTLKKIPLIHKGKKTQKYRHIPTFNGCGAFSLYLNFDEYSIFGFNECCIFHDLCYSTCGKVFKNFLFLVYQTSFD